MARAYAWYTTALYTAVNAPSPRNLIQIIVGGLRPIESEPGPIMPPFGVVLTDGQIASLTTYIRARYSAQPAWSGVATEVRNVREGKAGS